MEFTLLVERIITRGNMIINIRIYLLQIESLVYYTHVLG